uniref:Spermatosis associated 1 n=1 Tax=Poecilia latipinna TaxID=48699 RepID=A0A3B3TY45_9TELE
TFFFFQRNKLPVFLKACPLLLHSRFLELHVLFVPADQWDMKLNKVPAEATESFVSAGFIRVYPETTLQTLRGELAALLGTERSIHKFSFLKCVGRSLALVKGKQETNLKVKTFAPPYVQALLEEIKMVREERKQLEWTRQQLLRKGKDLLAQNRHRRNQARDSWKKKYFETKKTTAPLEEHLRNLRQELELFHNKVLHQLQAREKARRQGRAIFQNELIIQIMKESYEVDNLRRKVEDAKMKLITETKLRKQAATELRDLKTELAQKKNHCFMIHLYDFCFPAASLQGAPRNGTLGM